MLFGRAFENALAAFFARGSCRGAIPRMGILQDSGSITRAAIPGTACSQGIQLLDRFAQDDRVRIRQPRRSLQIKFTRPFSGQNDFVAYVDARGTRRPRMPAGMEDHLQPISGRTRRAAGSDPQLVCYSWITGISEVAQVVFVRKRQVEIQYLRTTISDEQRASSAGWWRTRSGASKLPVHAPQWHPLSPEPLHQLSLRWPLPGTAGTIEEALIRRPGEKTLIGLTSLITREPPMLPKLNRKRALFVLTKIDEILAWEQRNETERDTHFVELGRYLCEVRAGQYWRLENLKSFDEFLARRFPESRRKAYYLMSIHEHLPPEARKELKAVGWTKGLELAKVARREGQEFDCATWLHKARSMPKEEFKREVEKELTGKESEPWEIIYFKVYKSQIPVIEQAIETAALMLGTDKSRGYCLEMICADFLAGANLDSGNPTMLLR